MREQSNIKYYTAPYYRISNDDGDLAVLGKGESNSISNQRSLIEDYVKDKPDIILCEERIDDGFSGVNFERPAFKQMLEDVKAGKINCIIVKDLSRFGRNYIEVGRFIQKIFPCLGVRFIAINDNYDSVESNSMDDQFMLPFKNLMNDSYSRDLSVKIRSQFAVKRKKGEFVGSFTIYGYKKDTENKNHLVIDEYAAGIVRDIYRWRLEGSNNAKIAEKLNHMGVLSPAEYKRSSGLHYKTGFETTGKAQWSSVAVRRILTDQTYLGHVVQGKKTTPNYKVKKAIEKSPEEWIIVENMHDPIITRDKFDAVQRVLKMDTRTAPKQTEVDPFSGRLECADCKGNMVRKLVSAGRDKAGNVRKYPYYMCGNHKNDPHTCSSHMISERELEKAVLLTINTHIENLINLREVLSVLDHKQGSISEAKKNDMQRLEVNKEIVKLQSLKIALYEDLAEGVITKEECFEFNEMYKKQIEEYEKQAAYLKEEQELLSFEKIKKSEWMDTFLRHRNLTSLSRSIVLELIDKITVFEKGRVKIHFNFQYNYEMALKIVQLYEMGEEEQKLG